MMSCEQKDEQFSLRFLDCNCTCCGVRQRYVPSMACPSEQNQFKQLVKEISKPRYGLDCQCLCGESALATTADPCACPTTKATTTPIQVNFSVDTGVKPLPNASMSRRAE